MGISFRLMVLFILIVTMAQVFAEAVAPELVITDFVKAIQKNNIDHLKKYADLDKIEKQPKRSYTVEQLKALFENVDASKIEFSKSVADDKTDIIKIRINKPVSLEFEIQHQNSIKNKSEKKGDFYRIIGIHP